MPELQRLVADDHVLQASDKNTRKELIAQLTTHRLLMKKGARANNAAAANDFRATLKSINDEVCDSKFNIICLADYQACAVREPHGTCWRLFICFLNTKSYPRSIPHVMDYRF